MASDHLRTGSHAGHTHGTDAECPGCRETCHCENLPRYPGRACVHCRLVYLGLKP